MFFFLVCWSAFRLSDDLEQIDPHGIRRRWSLTNARRPVTSEISDTMVYLDKDKNPLRYVEPVGLFIDDGVTTWEHFQHYWIRITGVFLSERTNDAELSCSLCFGPEQAAGQVTWLRQHDSDVTSL